MRKAIFIERINRFVVLAKIEGNQQFVHLHDPGRLKELLVPCAKLFLRKAENPGRKTNWDVILVRRGNRLVVIYSTMSNRLVKALLLNRQFPGLKLWKLKKTEPRYGKGRFDFELSRAGRRMFIEVKSVSLVEDGIARFPDAPTERGRRHLLELADASKRGYEVMVIFVVTRNDALSMEPHRQRDPKFAETLNTVTRQGVKAVAYVCDVTLQGMKLNKRIPVMMKS